MIYDILDIQHHMVYRFKSNYIYIVKYVVYVYIIRVPIHILLCINGYWISTAKYYDIKYQLSKLIYHHSKKVWMFQKSHVKP